MKIAIIGTMAATPWGGSEELWFELAQAALQEGHQVYISTYKWPQPPIQIQHLRQQGAITNHRSNYAPTTNETTSQKIKRLKSKLIQKIRPWFIDLIQFNPDIVCISQGATFDAVQLIPDLIQTLQKEKIPYSIICQANSYDFHLKNGNRKISADFFQKSQKMFFVSHKNCLEAEKQLAIPLDNAVVVQNPINLKDLNPVKWLDTEICQFACVSRLHVPSKGQDILFDVLRGVEWLKRNWKLNLYGEGVDYHYLKDLAYYYGIAERVNFCGYVRDVRHIWLQNHILLMPSRLEGTPLALVEALLCARPAVVTDVGDNALLAKKCGSSFIAESATPQSLQKTLEKAWFQRDKWQEIGFQAHQAMLENLDFHPGQSLLKQLL
jgi:L-malate glycosyltransferase